MAASAAAAGALDMPQLRAGGLPLTSEEELGEDGALPLSLDITTEQLSLAGVEKEIEAYADSEVLRAILDQGAGGGGGGGGVPTVWRLASSSLQQRAGAAERGCTLCQLMPAFSEQPPPAPLRRPQRQPAQLAPLSGTLPAIS